MTSEGPARREQQRFGALLKRYRLAAGLSQEALAERARLSARAISAYERGQRRAPYRDTVALLVRALGLGEEDAAALEAAVPRWRGSGETPEQRVPAHQPRQPRPAGTPVPPLVGRADELALLARHLVGEGPPLLLLAGEPGIGKSRLIQEAVSRAAGQGWAVLQGGCSRRGGQIPFTPLLPALERHIHSRSRLQLQADLQGCAWLVRLLPELAEGPIEPLPAWVVSPEQERRLVYRAVARFLANVAGQAGTLLLLDDLQWAETDALDLLAALVQGPAEAPVRAVGAYRQTEVAPDQPLGLMVAEWAEAQVATLRPLRPLAQPEAEALFAQVGGAVPPGGAALVVGGGGGVPFFLLSYARGLESADGALATGVPWDLRQSLQRRVLALPEAGRALLAAAALAGRVTPRALLRAVVAVPARELHEALERACRAGLLEERGDDAYGFVHDVIREVVEAELGRARRALLHQQLAEALERQPGGAPAAVLAFHYARSDAREQALRYLEQAGDEALQGAAHGTAVGYYQELVARLDDLGRVVDAARVREKLGTILVTTGHYARALEVLARAAVALRHAGDMEGLGRVVAQVGRAHACRGTWAEGIAQLESHLEALATAGPTHGLAAVADALASLHERHGQYEVALAAATRAVAVARAVGDDHLLAGASVRRGQILLFDGRSEEALPVLQEASVLAEAVGHLDALGGAAFCLAVIAEDRGEFQLAGHHASRMLEAGERLEDAYMVRVAQFRLVAHAFYTGAWRDAHVYLERAAALPDRSLVMEAGTPFELARLCLVEGAWEEATAYLEQCRALLRHSGENIVYPVAECLLAEREVLEGRPLAALARLLPLMDRSGRVLTLFVLPMLAWAYLELDDIEQAACTIEDALQQGRAGHYWFGLVDALRVQALVALRQGDVAGTERALEEGLALAHPMPYPYSEGRLLAVYGRLHLHRGELAPARARLEAALAIFRRLGARKDSERTEQLLGSLG